MKKYLAVATISFVLYACKSANVATPAANAATKPAVDTTTQTDKTQDPTKQ